MRLFKNMLSLGIFLALFFTATYVTWISPLTGNSNQALADEDSEQETMKQVLTGIHFVGTKSITRDWELWSDQATGSGETSRWGLNRVKAIFYSDINESFTVLGDEGQADLKSENIEVSGNVSVISSNGYIMKTEAVYYDSENRTLSSLGEVDVIGESSRGAKVLSLKSGALLADLKTSIINLNEGVQSWRTTKDNQKIYLKSDRAELSGKTSEARFLDNVLMKMDDVRVTGPEAILEYDRKTSAINVARVVRGVRMKSEGRLATAEQLDIFMKQDIFKLSGNPRVIQDGDELRGQEIIFSNGGKRLEVRKVRAKVEPDKAK